MQDLNYTHSRRCFHTWTLENIVNSTMPHQPSFFQLADWPMKLLPDRNTLVACFRQHIKERLDAASKQVSSLRPPCDLPVEVWLLIERQLPLRASCKLAVTCKYLCHRICRGRMVALLGHREEVMFALRAQLVDARDLTGGSFHTGCSRTDLARIEGASFYKYIRTKGAVRDATFADPHWRATLLFHMLYLNEEWHWLPPQLPNYIDPRGPQDTPSGLDPNDSPSVLIKIVRQGVDIHGFLGRLVGQIDHMATGCLTSHAGGRVFGHKLVSMAHTIYDVSQDEVARLFIPELAEAYKSDLRPEAVSLRRLYAEGDIASVNDLLKVKFLTMSCPLNNSCVNPYHLSWHFSPRLNPLRKIQSNFLERWLLAGRELSLAEVSLQTGASEKEIRRYVKRKHPEIAEEL